MVDILFVTLILVLFATTIIKFELKVLFPTIIFYIVDCAEDKTKSCF